jgi:hypothetical protein
MAIQYLSSINLTTNQLQYAVIQPATTDPTLYTPVEGQIYYNSVSNKLRLYDGSSWSDVGSGVSSFTATDGTFINLTPNTTQTGAVTLTAELSASGTPSSSVYLRGDNTWSPISGIYSWSIQGGTGGPTTVASGTNITFAGGTNVTTSLIGNTLTINATNAAITLTGDVTGTGTTSIVTTIATGAVEFSMMDPAVVVTSSEGIENNNNNTTLPTSAAVKAYVDASVAGGLIYQGGYDAATNTPNLDLPPTITGIKKGWTYTVTVEGTFFTEQVRVGDVLIAEIDAPTTLADWTTVQNNIDLASLTQVGIGNVNAGTGIDVSYSSGTATVSAQATSYATTISATATITHNLGTRDVIIQLYDTVTYETVYSDNVRTTTNTATITFASAPTNPIRVVVQK